MKLKKIDVNEIAKNVKEDWVNMDIAVVMVYKKLIDNQILNM